MISRLLVCLEHTGATKKGDNHASYINGKN